MQKRQSITASFLTRISTILISCALFILMAFCLALPAMAQTAITWDDLQSHSTHLSNPYKQLTSDQTYRISTLYQLKEWVQENQPAPDSYEVKEIQRLEKMFAEEGVEPSKLLLQVDEARAYWESQSQITNPKLEDRSVQLSGYVLPLNKNNPTQPIQRVSEFLLVPFVGACSHVPPPPPNQIIYIKPEAAIANPGLFTSVRVTGKIRENISSHELYQVDGSRRVDVSYAMELDAIAPVPNAAAPNITGSWWQTLPVRVSGVLTVSLGNLSNHTSPQTLALAILLSFSYGVLHTLGPGHGKAVIASYFVGHDGSLQRGLVMGIRIAVFHVLSAVVIAILTHTVLQQFGGNSAGSYRIIRLVSYGAIALIGARMLKQALKQNRIQSSNDPSTPHPASLTANPPDKNAGDRLLYPSLSQQISASVNQPNLADCNCLTCDDRRGVGGWLALAVGAVPCSGALLVLLYGLANNLLWPSITMVIAISAGMACTLGWIGAIAIIGNRYGQKLAIHHQQKWPWPKKRPKSRFSLIQSGQIMSAICISLLGIGLFSLTLLTAK